MTSKSVDVQRACRQQLQERHFGLLRREPDRTFLQTDHADRHNRLRWAPLQTRSMNAEKGQAILISGA